MNASIPRHGTIALQGGGAFTANDELDRRLLASVGATRVFVLPTADAFERPEKLISAAVSWGERLNVEVEALMVMRRGEAVESGPANVVRRAKAVYFVGDQPMHLRSVLKDTPLWDALHDVLTNGGLVAAVGGSAAAMCDPMVDPRGGAFTLGLGLVPNLALVTEAETWSPERLHRTRKLANTAFAVMHTGDALVRVNSVWESVGATEVHGELP
jgi:cyanophycinase